jgi:hypothetical protein
MALQRVKLCAGSLAIIAGCAAGLLMLGAGEASATVHGFNGADWHDNDHDKNHNRGHNHNHNHSHNHNHNHNGNENINIIVIELPPNTAQPDGEESD